MVPLAHSITVVHESKLCDVMRQLEEQLIVSLQELSHSCLSACAEMKGPDWVASFPLQCITLVDSIVWTDRCRHVGVPDATSGGLFFSVFLRRSRS